MDISPYAILGLDENAAVADAEAAFGRITASLNKLKDDDKNGTLARKVLEKNG